MQLRYAAGVVNHGTYDLLERCLVSLKEQSCPPAKVVVVDSGSDPEQAERLRAAFPDLTWKLVRNHGFGAAANLVLRHPECSASHSDFVLLLNADVELTPSFAEIVMREADRRSQVALASGKLLRPDGRTIDSTGIVMPRNRRPYDRGSGQFDAGQYDRVEEVFGVSGAALMIRSAAIPELKIDDEVFDEDFFLYHEDTDLAWRARQLGWSSLYVPDARAVHRRGWRSESRWCVPDSVRRHSFKNHYLEMIKNEEILGLLRDLPIIVTWEALRFGFALLVDRSLMGGYASALRLAGRAWRKRRRLRQKIARRPS